MCKKKVIAIIMAASMMLTLVSCSANSNSSSKSASASVDNIKKDTEVSSSISTKTATKTTDKDLASTESEVAGNETKNSEENYYVLNEKELILYFPKEWEKQTIFVGQDIYLVDKNATSVNLVVESTQGLDKDQYYKAVLADLKLNTNGTNLKSKYYTTDGIDYVIDEYDETFENKNYTSHIYQFTIVKNGTAYILTAVSKPENIELGKEKISQVVKMIKFK